MQWQLRGDRPIYQQIMEKLTEQIVSGQLNGTVAVNRVENGQQV